MEKQNVWYDSTIYSRGDTERKPTCWTFDTGMLRITVVSGHRGYPGGWVMHCYHVGFDTVLMGITAEKPAEYAQRLALKMVRKKLSMMLESLPKED
jgi:hypothetical protein